MKNPVLRAIMIIIFISLFAIPSLAEIGDLKATEQFYVADYADVISSETEAYIVSLNDILYEKTGAQVVVATVDFLDGAEIEDYAYKLFNNWKIGSTEKNNGVLLLMVIGEENYWAVQGKGLEKTLSSGTLGDLLNDYLEPDFAVEDYDAGARKIFDAIIGKLQNIYGVPITDGNNNSDYLQDNYDYYPDNGAQSGNVITSILSIIFDGFFMIFKILIFFIIIAVVINALKKANRKKYGNNYDDNQDINQNNNGENNNDENQNDGDHSDGNNNNNPTIPPTTTPRPIIPPIIFLGSRGFWDSRSRGSTNNKPSSGNRGGFGGGPRGGGFGGGPRGGGGGGSRGGGAGRR